VAAHLFQLSIVGQLPIVAFFAIRWLQRTPRRALMVLASQGLAVLVVCAPVFFFQL
jgi:type II secretory pathway component PulM